MTTSCREGQAERASRETTDRVLAHLSQESKRPLFLWVHYYDPHSPYTPPEPFRSRYRQEALSGRGRGDGRATGAARAGIRANRPRARLAIVVVGDHGEGLGEHGESQHGNLLYQATMHVPLLLVGPGIPDGPER